MSDNRDFDESKTNLASIWNIMLDVDAKPTASHVENIVITKAAHYSCYCWCMCNGLRHRDSDVYCWTEFCQTRHDEMAFECIDPVPDNVIEEQNIVSEKGFVPVFRAMTIISTDSASRPIICLP